MTMNKSCLQKPSILKDGFFTLPRKTRPGLPSENKMIYTKNAFDSAMREYIDTGGKLYLAPVSVGAESGYSIDMIRRINDKNYRDFHYPNVKEEYLFGRAVRWSDYDITFKYTPTEISSKLLYLVSDNTSVALRYIPLGRYSKKEPISKMRIVLLDIGVIPLDMVK